MIKNFLKLLFESYKNWVKDRATGMAAGIAYYEFLSLAPLIGFLIFSSHKILGQARTQEDVIPLLKNWFTPQFVKVITFMLSSIDKINPENLYTLSIISGLSLAWSTKEYFAQINDINEIIWNERREEFGIKYFFLNTFRDVKVGFFFLILFMAFIFLRSLLPHPNITEDSSYFHESGFFLKFGQGLTEFIILFFLFLYFFIMCPPVKIYWKSAMPGALLAAVLQLIGREIMRVHMFEDPDADVAESLIVVLLWFYYSGLVFVYASEFNMVYVSTKQNMSINN